ncbi:hypothetical protein M0811_06991 [Anaeramoeba ignava]|uniref:Uncharacterized protein n=1 Tax=Anaeramoeba ignava TaxID=1746090 RepID=A0A9Q0LNL8_ANAIG|nr:hypothetical protein M0811_06991 [Anaeramoeba ignava]
MRFLWWKKLDKYSKIFLVCSLIEAILLIVNQIIRILEFRNNKSRLIEEHIDLYAILFFLGVVYAGIYVFIIIKFKNIFQLVSFAIVNVMLTIYAIYELVLNRSSLATLVFLLVVVLIYDAFYTFMLIRLYKEFTWDFWNRVGSQPLIQKLFKVWSIFLTILGLDLMFSSAFLIADCYFLWSDYSKESYIDIALIIILIFWGILGYYCFRDENTKLMGLFLFSSLFEIAYLIAKIALFTHRKKLKNQLTPISVLIILTAVILLLRIFLWIICIIGYRNFGLGLKARLTRDYIPISPESNSNKNRLEIMMDGSGEDSDDFN